MAKNRILVVEDDKDIAQSIKLNLDLSGYESVVFHDGAEVCEYLKQDNSFDMALLDVMLPGLDGFELMQHMNNYNIAVIFLTAKIDVNSRVKGLKGGAEDYIVKPFEMLELLVRMEKILDRNGKLNSILRYTDITIDTIKREVTKAGIPVAMQPLEFELLVKLVKFKNCTFSRDRLLSEIWGIDFVGGTRTVDIHISNLRKKLGLQEHIVTVTKLGYRLEDV